MKKDPTEFRLRFKKWKETGEYELPRFEDGYETFFNTLPENQKRGSYPTRRYWELNGKPKDFAEAVGKGMYTVLNDDGTLNWHAGSIAYNKNADKYEFMKANYHPTRWMELVYGYDQSPEFLKDWKVLYNGPMLSDRYVRREKPGLKVKGGQLPKFGGGIEQGTFSTIFNAVPWKGYVNKTRKLIGDVIKLAPSWGGMITSMPEIDFKTNEGFASYGDVVGTVTAEYGKSYLGHNGWGLRLDRTLNRVLPPSTTTNLPSRRNTGISNKTFGKGMYGIGTLLTLPDMYYDIKLLWHDYNTPAEKYAE